MGGITKKIFVIKVSLNCKMPQLILLISSSRAILSFV